MSLQTQASLAVAALDLELVRLLRGAIRVADLSGGGRIGPLGTIVSPPSGLRDRFESEPIFEPRPRIHPTPHFEPRPVIHPTPRIAPEYQCVTPACAASSPPPASSATIAARPAGEGPLPPPWRMPAWKIPIPPAPLVKVHIHRTDVHNKGSLIDLFL